MPSLIKTKKKFEKFDQYTKVPTILFELISHMSLTTTEAKLLNYIILHSLNFHGPYARAWVIVSPTAFSSSRGITRDAVCKSLSSLISFGIIGFRSVKIHTNSGVQNGREFSLVSNKRLAELLEVASSQGVSKNNTPKNVDNLVGVYPQYTECIPTVYTSGCSSIHLGGILDTPVGVKPLESLKKKDAKYSLNTIKYFLNMFHEFQNSFLELYINQTHIKSEQFKIKMKIASVIRQYGLFSTYRAMSDNIFSKDAVIGDFDALNEYLKLNELDLKEDEKNLKTQSDIVFNALLEIHEKIEVDDLGKFHENFKASASALLIRMSQDKSCMIFLYSSFHEDVIEIFKISNFNIDRFTKEVLRKINLFLKAKVIGVKEIGIDLAV
jgi:hypothetical protein